MHRLTPLLAISLFPVAMAQCAAQPMSAALVPQLSAAIAQPQEDPLFRAGLAAFQSGQATDGWIWPDEESEQWVLLGVSLANGRHGEEKVWFVRLSTPTTDQVSVEEFTVPAAMGPLRRGTKFHSPAAHVHIESFDHRGRPVRSSNRTVPGNDPSDASDSALGLEALGRSLAEGTQAGSGDDGSQEAQALAKLAISLQQIGRAGALRPIRNEARKSVIREPNIFTLILNAFRINVRADFTNAELLAEPWLPALNVPQYLASSPLYIAGQHVVNFSVVLGPLQGPYSLTAGLLGLEATHPDRPQNKLTVRVLATQPAAD